MPSPRPSLFARDDTFFGICQGLGEDLRISPDLLRLGLALALFFNPVATIAAYLGLGVIVMIARFAFPVRTAEPAPAQEVLAAPATGNDPDRIELAEAA
ncbi:PspC domain-containing protein [Sphingomonas lenta]|uniref:Phage shock protein PspC N-terminal domain-containing protein n=1 Tax=Sphingomonas lenta TaxID=1141887 RepID=A0A2A2SGG1_9SPHN|nr:PspC domain-containing protein [Sphingomonas lenta]PAX08293.1 hypothetical protein CKY28_12115 [Sphingomonas lenta]